MNTSKTPTKDTKLVIRFFLSPIDKKPSLLHKSVCESINHDLDTKGINISETVLGYVKALKDTKEFLINEFSFHRGSIAEYLEINSEIIEVENV